MVDKSNSIGLPARYEDICRTFSPDLVHYEDVVFFKDMVVPVLVGDRKRVPRGGAGAEAEMVAFRLVGVKHGGEVAKTLAAAQLPEYQHEQLMPACEMLHMEVAVVLVNQTPEFVVIKKNGKLCKYIFVFVHL